MSINQTAIIREVFRLGGGLTVLACEGALTIDALAGRGARILVDGKDRQRIVVASERILLNQKLALSQRALETCDSVILTPEEVRNGRCELVLE
jgi:hypothetical protein